MQVVAMDGSFALCKGRDRVERVDTTLTGELQTGQWVLCSLGAAREVVDAEHAAKVESALCGLESILSGINNGDDQGSIDALINSHFSDLVNREPQLPDVLRPAADE